jgi:hypothetical protein
MLDSLDRSLRIVDELEASCSADSADARARLRLELHHTISCLQFQDITSQQLGYAGTVLLDVEGRIDSLARLINHNLLDRDEVDNTIDLPDGATFDPRASMQNSAERQAVADEIFPPRTTG